MNSRIAVVVLGIVVAFSSSALAQVKFDVASVKWMSGCWENKNEKKGSVILEHWTSSEGGTLFGIGRTFRQGKLVSWEMMRIAQQDDSAKFFAQLPDAARATPFALKSANAAELIFENLENDFPHRVIYRNAGANKLAARIEGKIDGKDKGIDFPMTRVKCE